MSKAKKIKFDNILTPEEKILYEKVLEDIANNEDFYNTSSPEEITSHLIDECGFDRKEIYKMFKKIASADER